MNGDVSSQNTIVNHTEHRECPVPSDKLHGCLELVGSVIHCLGNDGFMILRVDVFVTLAGILDGLMILEVGRICFLSHFFLGSVTHNSHYPLKLLTFLLSSVTFLESDRHVIIR